MQKKNSAFMFSILVSLSMAHGFNDSIQSVISAMYPVIKSEMALSYAQIGMVILGQHQRLWNRLIFWVNTKGCGIG